MLSRAKLASLVTVLALGTLAAVAFAAGSGGDADPAAVQTQDDQAPQVRTEVVRKTVHRRAKAAGGSSGSSGASSSGGSGRSTAAAAPATPAAPAVTASPVATPDDHGRRHGGHGEDDDGFDDHGRDDDGFDDHGGEDDDFGDDSSGHGGGDDSSGHGGGDDDSGHGRGRGRGGDGD